MIKSIVRSVAIVSVYNAKPDYLQKQLDSMLNQSVNLDIFIRDDGSTDPSCTAALQTYLESPRIRMIFGKNVGFVKSFFEALRLAGDDYDYYFIADQDDFWEQHL